MEMDASNTHHTPDTDALMDTMRNLTRNEGVTLTPLPKV
ncbi:hypothetical protein Rleg4DRAFT_6946 [Rhizobium leguminosarum bv. trifolii WSM2297]|uniref:Uncharacterized protein n=1 Tax=Rhizobium leguminosarum bv. trifolii WSM2297 TaxID=754762 RepID=J0WC10_RHILT|nr:hypothetical protein Rleg4DRAFT_5074 [Rhizobium leguminosarum bv. trifolii WSM2297]EJC85084.1 hypothetical protein Rleg4DRAFT_6946 [Rhizobium leguminosarum bv. trifolii WSM2297]